MSGESWTPGPWHAEWNGYFWDIRPECSIHCVLSINSAWDDDPEAIGTEEANAYLVQAAPDLYEALVAATSVMYDDPAREQVDQIVDRALAKARGENT